MTRVSIAIPIFNEQEVVPELLRRVGAVLANGTGGYRYVQTAVIADLPFGASRSRRSCVEAGR